MRYSCLFLLSPRWFVPPGVRRETPGGEFLVADAIPDALLQALVQPVVGMPRLKWALQVFGVIAQAPFQAQPGPVIPARLPFPAAQILFIEDWVVFLCQV